MIMMMASVDAFPYGFVIAGVLIYFMSDSGSKYIMTEGTISSYQHFDSNFLLLPSPQASFEN